MIAKYQTKTAYLTTTALFAALVCLATAYLFHIPVGVNMLLQDRQALRIKQ